MKTPKKSATQQRHQAVREYFNKLKRRRLETDYAIERAAQKYYLSRSYVYKILKSPND